MTENAPRPDQNEWYRQLKDVARRLLRGERLPMRTTDLTHETWTRQAWAPRVMEMQGREPPGAIMAFMSTLVRRTLIDLLREHKSKKRGGGHVIQSGARLENDIAQLCRAADPELIEGVMRAMQTYDARQAQIVELKIFCELTKPQIAAALGCSLSTVDRDWRHAVLWLRREIRRREGEGEGEGEGEQGEPDGSTAEKDA